MSSYDWNNYLSFALDIVKCDKFDEQTKYRIAISRAYYAAFHIAKNMAEQLKKIEIPMTGGEHEKICNAYKDVKKGNKEFQDKCHFIGRNLELLKKERRDSDYDASRCYKIGDVGKSYKRADTIINDVNELKNQL